MSVYLPAAESGPQTHRPDQKPDDRSANVLFTAAHRPQGKAAFLFHYPQRWTLLSSEYALEKCRRNLAVKFPDAVGPMRKLALQLDRAPQVSGVSPLAGLAGKDQPIFQAAVAGRCTHLLTGDLRDFGPFMNQPEQTRGLIIQTVADFLADC